MGHGLCSIPAMSSRGPTPIVNSVGVSFFHTFAYVINRMNMATKKKDPRLERAGVSGYNKPKKTPSHPKKSHVVVAKQGDKVKTIRFGEQGAKTAGKPKEGESEAMKKKRASFKARHGKNIAKGKMSAAYWADREKW